MTPTEPASDSPYPPPQRSSGQTTSPRPTHRRRHGTAVVLTVATAFVAGAVILPSCSVGSARNDDESTRIADTLCLHEGQTVADVGAGDGDWAEALADRVGPTGLVWATEVRQSLVDDLEERFDSEDYRNVRAVLGDQDQTGLPASCCDAILVRLVYHHFEDPSVMRADLRRALAPGGRLLVVDIHPQDNWSELVGVPDRGGHGIPLETLKEEMTSDGFRVISQIDAWNDDEERFAILFAVDEEPSRAPKH